MALMQFTVIPVGSGTPSVGEYVALIQKALERERVAYTLNDMGTVVEGKADDLFALAAKMHNLCFQRGLQRVVTQVSVDDRRDKEVGLGDKIKSVRNRLE